VAKLFRAKTGQLHWFVERSRYAAEKQSKIVFSIFFLCVSSTLKDFALNPKNLGTEIAMTMVLHTHNRKLDFHPHIHVVVPGGGADKHRRQWKKKKGSEGLETMGLFMVMQKKCCFGYN
jgi:hypothetical protein